MNVEIMVWFGGLTLSRWWTVELEEVEEIRWRDGRGDVIERKKWS